MGYEIMSLNLKKAIEVLKRQRKHTQAYGNPDNYFVSYDELFLVLEALSSEEPKERCPACGTETDYLPGIGAFCPNKKCERIDDLQPVKPQSDELLDDILKSCDISMLKTADVLKVISFVRAHFNIAYSNQIRYFAGTDRELLDYVGKKVFGTKGSQ
jgi:hypothetical protein